MALVDLSASPPSQDICHWNKVIKDKLLQGIYKKTIIAYLKMQESGFLADNYTFPVLLKAASNLSSLHIGSALHCQAAKTGFCNHAFVQTALINMYSAFGCVVDARRVFEHMDQRDTVAWNSILDAYASNRQVEECFGLFASMPVKDQVTFNTMIYGYANVGDIDNAQKIFDRAPTRDAFSWNMMISAYARVGKMDSARFLFDQMEEKNVVSCNAIITGYLQSERYTEVLHLFNEMKAGGYELNHLTLASIISACAHMGLLETGIEIHIYAKLAELSSSPHVAAALIDMYSKCGSIEKALEVFYKTRDKDLYCWNSMISGLAFHGHGKASIKLFDEMKERGLKPDNVTFIGVLTACSHAGLVTEGYYFFESMKTMHDMLPQLQHYSCMVDLLGRAGHLVQAYEIVDTMPFEPGVTVLGALLSACIIHGNLAIGESVAELIAARSDQMSDGEYMMLANFYSKCERWQEAMRWREMMNGKGVKKAAGWSMIEVVGEAHWFLAGDI